MTGEGKRYEFQTKNDDDDDAHSWLLVTMMSGNDIGIIFSLFCQIR